MTENLKDLEKLLKLCRRQGVTEIKWGNVDFKLGELPGKREETPQEETMDSILENFPDDVLTPEELTFFANGGKPEDNPYRVKQE